jgi:hypothetical protein
METTWKATLAGIGGIAVGGFIAFVGILAAMGPGALIPFGDDDGSLTFGVFSFVAFSLALGVAFAALWLAARISGQPHRLRSAATGFATGGLFAVAGFEFLDGLGGAVFMATPAIAIACAVRPETRWTFVPRTVAVLGGSVLLFAIGAKAEALLPGAIVLSFATPLADAATDEWLHRTTTTA